jgi:ABC-type protease/lipase transport system fused ATPase/permease subunit
MAETTKYAMTRITKHTILFGLALNILTILASIYGLVVYDA